MIDDPKIEGVVSCIRGFIDSDPQDKVNIDFKEEQLTKLYIEYKELTGYDYIHITKEQVRDALNSILKYE